MLLHTSPPVSDSDAEAYLQAVEQADQRYLEESVRESINDFVVGCKSDGIWDAIKASCILAGARTLDGALVPLKGTAPTNLNFVSGDYVRKTGLKGNASTKYLNSNRINNADPQNNKHMAVFMSQIGSAALIGAHSTSQILEGAPLVYPRLNGTGSVTNAFSVGLIAASRSVSTFSNYRINSITGTMTSTSGTPISSLICVFCRGPGQILTSARLSFYSLGESLDLALLDTRVSTLMSDLAAAI